VGAVLPFVINLIMIAYVSDLISAVSDFDLDRNAASEALVYHDVLHSLSLIQIRGCRSFLRASCRHHARLSESDWVTNDRVLTVDS